MKLPFYTKVVGTTHRNEDGGSRLEIIAACSVGEPLLLVHDPKNRYDHRAVMVLRTNGEQIGFLRAGLAADIAPLIEYGISLTAKITKIADASASEPPVVTIFVSEGAAPPSDAPQRKAPPPPFESAWQVEPTEVSDLSFLDAQPMKRPSAKRKKSRASGSLFGSILRLIFGR